MKRWPPASMKWTRQQGQHVDWQPCCEPRSAHDKWILPHMADVEWTESTQSGCTAQTERQCVATRGRIMGNRTTSPIKLFSFLGIGTNHINYIYYDYDCLAIYKNSTPDTEGAQWKPVIICGCQTFWARSKACWVGVHGLVLPIFLPGQGGGSVATGYLPHVGSLSSVDLRETKLHLLTLLGYWQA